MKSRIISVVLCALLALVSVIMMSYDTPDAGIVEKRIELAIRKIGHELLLQAGDSTSRVLPVTRVGEETYQLTFDNELTFKSDSLRTITNRNLLAAGLRPGHLVTVLDRATLEMIYGFEERSTSAPINPCLGRVQPTAKYAVQVTFTEPIAGTRYYKTAGFAIMLTAVGLLVLVWPKRQAEAKEDQKLPNQKFEFDETTGFLNFDGREIPLTNKESKVLRVLFASVNQVVDRDQLLSAVWESEGVITGRSLDVFISKLRKKFDSASGVRIVNIHGRGYRLEVNIPQVSRRVTTGSLSSKFFWWKS